MKKLGKFLLYVLVGILGLLSMLIMPGLMLGGMMIAGDCGDEILQTIRFEKGKIELHQGNCGATTDFTYEFEWKGRNGNTSTFPTFEVDFGEPYFEVVKETRSKVILSYTPGTKMEEKKVEIDDITFVFQERKVNIDAPKDFLSMKRELKGLNMNFYINYLEIYQKPESAENQMSYAIDDRGFKNPNFDSTWFPFGFVNVNENEINSPLYIKKGEANHPVYIENEETNEKIKIASSYERFERMVTFIKNLPYGKDYCDNPAKDKGLEKKRKKVLSIFQKENPDSSIEFWEEFIPSKPYRKNEPCGF